MIARVDGRVFPVGALKWPTMNFGQFRWAGRIGHYELELPRAEFVRRLDAAYTGCVGELSEDDGLVPGETSRVKSLGYPPLDRALDDPAARRELIQVYLWDDIFAAYLPMSLPSSAWFVVNSIDDQSTTPTTLTIRGRGYYQNNDVPSGFASP